MYDLYGKKILVIVLVSFTSVSVDGCDVFTYFGEFVRENYSQLIITKKMVACTFYQNSLGPS